MTTLNAPVKSHTDLTDGVNHATKKVSTRQALGEPIPGLHDATIRVTLAKRFADRNRGTVTIDEVGNRILHTRNGLEVAQGNILDAFSTHLPRLPSHQNLDRITLINATGDTVLAQYERAGMVWNRVR